MLILSGSIRSLSSLFARVLGVLHSPRTTFDAVARAPRWFGVVALAFLVATASTAILLETEVGQLALLDQWERRTYAFGQSIDDGQYAALEEASRHGAAVAALSSLASGPLLTVGLSGLFFAIFQAGRPAGRVAGRVASRPDEPVLAGRSAFADRPTYRQVLAVVAHAGVILALRQVIAAPITYTRESLASPTTLAVFFTMLDEASWPARVFGILDLFVIWWIVVLAIGMSVLYGRPARRLATMFVGTYVTLAVVLAVVMAITGGTA